jgi:hypothetical protein
MVEGQSNTPDSHIALAVVARPARLGLLVEAEIKGVHWLRMFESALATQTRYWGGQGNLLFPLTQDITDREEFWVLADAFDADAFLTYAPTWSEMEGIHPSIYGDQVSAWRDQVTARVDAAEAERFIADALSQAAFHPEVPGDQLDLISRRLSPFSHPGSDDPHLEWFDGSNPAQWPYTDISEFQALPEAISIPTAPGFGAARRLLLTSLQGRVPGALMKTLGERDVQFFDRPVGKYNTYGRRSAVEEQAPPDPWTLSMVGASYFQRAGLLRLPVALVVGDSPWDFALFYALLRMTGRSWWLPSWLRRDRAYRQALEMSLRLDSYSDARKAVVVSTSSASTRDEVARTILEVEDIKLDVADWKDVLPDEPMTILGTDTPGRARLFPLVNESVLELDTPVPSIARTKRPAEMRWLSEARGSEWAPIRSRALGERLMTGGSDLVRTSRSGVAYFSTSSLVLSGASLESVVVRPRLRPMTLPQQIEELLRTEGWTCEASDKAIYALESMKLFGGFGNLCNAILDPQIRAIIDAFRSKKGPGARLSADRRRYLRYTHFEGLLGLEDARPVIEPLLDRQVLIRGVVLRCARCRQAEWHSASTAPDRFTCGRCDLSQQANRDAWFGTAEPVLSYRLAEVMFQLFEHDGELPLLVAKAAFGESPDPVGRGYELSVSPPQEKAHEVDIFESDGHRLWVGEASTDPHLDPERLQFLARLSKVVDAYGILLGTSEAAWSAKTEAEARALFPGPWPQLRFLVAVRTTPAPPISADGG